MRQNLSNFNSRCGNSNDHHMQKIKKIADQGTLLESLEGVILKMGVL